MYVMQLIFLKNIGNNKELGSEKNILEDNISIEKENDLDSKTNLINTSIKDQIKNTNQIKATVIKKTELKTKLKSQNFISSFQDLINIVTKEKEVELKYDLERNVNLVNFSIGTIDISFNDRLNKNFIKNLTEKLLLWTGQRWVISLSKKKGADTVYEKNMENKKAYMKQEEKSETSKKLFSAFPDAKLIEIKEEKND
jgi:DNA polymerase-3 subunit gamma/tau